MLKKVYASECNYSAYGIDYRDFYLGFTSKKTRDWVLNDIESSVESYQANNGIGGSGSDPDGKKGTDSTALYIAIGVAVAVVLALMLDRKKK